MLQPTNEPFAIESLGSATEENPIGRIDDLHFVDEQERLLLDPHLFAVKRAFEEHNDPAGFEVAGPRRKIFFNSSSVSAAIVTCGGLCPGLNAVIRGLVMELWHRYGCRRILGIRYGYRGLSAEGERPLELTPDAVLDIHTTGGTILSSSRGTPPTSELVDGLERLKVDMLFVIGGDGTMRGAHKIWEEVRRRQLAVAVVGVPKTIDNDIPYVRRSFGFETAVAIASQAIHAAHAEASGAPNGIGLVKLMGRRAGFIAANAALAAGHANFCLVPEVPFGLDGPDGLFNQLEERLLTRHHAVIVVAEGAGQYFFKAEQQLDASGNVKFGDIGVYLRDRFNAHFKERGVEANIKYIDPSYMIRSAAANPNDLLFCARMAQNAVHAAMAGKGGMLIGHWHGRITHVPMRALNDTTRAINPRGELWFNVLETTGQPGQIGQPPHSAMTSNSVSVNE